VLITTVCLGQTQKSHFLLHPNEISFNPLSTTTINSNSNSYIAGNSLYGKDGNLLFYVHAWSVYDANDNIVGGLSDYYSGNGSQAPHHILYNEVQHEIAIVPFEEECKYYVIYLNTGSEDGNPGNNLHQALMYSIVETSGSSVTVTSTTGSDPSQLIDRFDNSILGGIAVSPKLLDGQRFLFCVAGGEVNRYKISNQGIFYESTIAIFDDFELRFNPDITELELFWNVDEDGFEAKLGWGMLAPNHDGNVRAVTVDLDQNGDNIGHIVHEFQGLRNIVGFEFAPNNSDLFFISAMDNSFNQGVYYKDGSNPYQMVSNSTDCWSHIEYGRDGRMYVADNNGDLKYFAPTASSPAVSSSGISINSDDNHGAVGLIPKFYTLPDQIDGVDNVFDAAYNNIESDFTMANDFFEWLLPTVYGSSLPYFNICESMTLIGYANNAVEYRVSLYQLDANGDTLPTLSQPWLPFINQNIKHIPFNTNYDHLIDIINDGKYMIKVEVKNACGVTDTKVGYFEVIPPNYSTIPITINGSAPNNSLPTSTPFNIYSCSTQVALLNDNGWNAHSYKVTLQSVTSSGVPTSSLNTSTNWELNFSAIADLKNLPAPNGTWLTNAANTGYYKVTLDVGYDCNGDGMRDVLQNYDGYFYLEQPPSQPSIALLVSDTSLQYDTQGNPTIRTNEDCNSKSATLMCSAPQNGPEWIAGIGTFGQYNIEQYSRKIEQVNCSDGLSPVLIYQDPYPIIVSPNQTVVSDKLNVININGSQGYFADPNKVGNCYKLTITVYNVCGSASDYSFFELDSRLYRKKKQSFENNKLEEYQNNTVEFYPNPVNDRITLEMEHSQDFAFSATIYDLKGKRVQKVYQNKSFAKGKHITIVNLNRLSSGIYFIEYSMNGHIKRQKIIKQ